MSIFSRFFKNNDVPSIPERNTDDVKAIAELIGCDYEKIDGDISNEEATRIYIDAYHEGQKSGYIPIIVLDGSVLKEALEINLDNEGAEKYREKLLSKDIMNGTELLKERFDWYVENYVGFNKCVIDELYGEFKDDVEPLRMLSCYSYNSDDKPILVRIPADNPWEVFAWIPFGGWNDCPPADEMMAVCKHWYEKYGALPAVVSSDTLQMYVPKPIEDNDTALKIAEEQYGFCNDSVDQGAETIKALASVIKGSNVWYFWWD